MPRSNPKSAPLVSLAIPINKTNAYYIDSLRSALNQTYSNIEIHFIDSSQFGIYVPKYIRSKVFHHRVSCSFGISDSLNYAIKVSIGRYFARLDSDDLCLPSRIMEQVSFLEENPTIGLIGSAVYAIRDKDTRLLPENVQLKPLTHHEILLMLLDKTSFYHPTVMIRTELFKKYPFAYRPKYDSAEDYDLWVRMSHNIEMANLAKPLVALRMHEQQYSKQNKKQSDALALRIRNRHLFWMFLRRKINTGAFIHKLKGNIKAAKARIYRKD